MTAERRTDQEEARRAKLARLRTLQDAYPARVARTHTTQGVHESFAELEASQAPVTVAGRTRAVRLHGGSLFLDVEDRSGRLQGFVSQESIGEEQFVALRDLLDVGDFVTVTGRAFVTKRGEQSLAATDVHIVAKALRPLPAKWHGLADPELRYRKRELDLLVNRDVRTTFEHRASIVAALRRSLTAAGFLELETPVLQSVAGGASARPFVTHHNALDTDLYLRVAPELFLKRAIVGGFERVFEFARCFRNEGIDRTHNPEFTQVEGYWAFQDYRGLMDFIEDTLRSLVAELYGNTTAYDATTIDWSEPFQRVRYRDALNEHAGIDLDANPNEATLLERFRELALDLPAERTLPHLIDELYRERVRPKLVHPTYLTDHPVSLSPLAKRHVDQPNYVERFQLVVGGLELVNAFSELNDPDDQAERFRQQDALRLAGDSEAQPTDPAFLEALEYGMPPTAGFGIGIDRLVALLEDQRSVKDVILFPTLKPKSHD